MQFLAEVFSNLWRYLNNFTEDSEDYIAVPFKEDPKEELAATLENNS